MLVLGYIAVFCVLHVHSTPGTKDNSILLHTLKKRDVADQIGPIPYTQHQPQPISDASQDVGGDDSVYGHTAILNPNLDQSDQQYYDASRAHTTRTPLYRQYSPELGGSSGRASHEYSSSQSYSSQSGSQSGSSRTPTHTRSTGTQTQASQSGLDEGYDTPSLRTYNSPAQTNNQDNVDDSQGNPTRTGQSRGTQTDPRYTGYVYNPGTGGATATYSPTGTRRRDPTQTAGRSTNTGTYYSGGSGPTGRRPTVAASYPLGPILSTGGGQPLDRRQPNTGQQVFRQTPGYRTYTVGGQQPYYSSSNQYTYSTRQQQPSYTVRQQQPHYGGGGQPTHTGGQPTYAGGQPTYTGGQPTYTGGQPTYTGGQATGQGYVPYGYNPSGQQYPYNPNHGNCPETGIRMRINGMDCARAVDFYGSFLCYRHEFTSRECCEKCRPLKNAASVGCEFGDHSYQCRQIQPHDCYDLRNRQSCCNTCDQHRSGEAGCEYGDMTPRCERVTQNPSLCYIPENQRLCCHTCRRLRGSDESQVCPWGDQNANLCRPFDQYGGVRINCYAEQIRRLCCQTCERLRARMPNNIVGCEYGDRPVIFNTGEFGSLNCTSFFRHFPVEQCTVNQAVAINCCFTCHRYQDGGRQRQRVERQQASGQDAAGRG
ncbi:uncharacterized protein LOC124149805 isoform X2 [Haliotis rufescens]|uniref:uncharacterized protein LOC124149805 isoform X2 n=1 Tax=Haliotis rufescens TaxID=6454 RepID=UPI00201EA920|nr:uncharacterized protein LOC124149805 isoform X2 [Haliotis rufescens]